MDTIKPLDQTVQLKGRLRMHLTPQGLVSSNGWSDESNCLLFEIGEEFHYDQGRKVEYILRLRSVGQEQPESPDSRETMLFDSLTPMQAMQFDPSCSAQAVLYGANTDMTDLGLEDADLYEIAELPTRHIFLSEGEVGKPLMQRAIKRDVVTLGLFLDDAVRFLPALLADLAPSAPLRHVAIIPNFSGISSVEQDDVKLLVDALLRSTSSSQLEGVLFEISSSILPYGFISLLRTTTHVGMRFPESIYWSVSLSNLSSNSILKVTPCFIGLLISIRKPGGGFGYEISHFGGSIWPCPKFVIRDAASSTAMALRYT